MIKIGEVVKRYNKITALNRVSLNIGAEVVALLGANGAGKSTLLKLLLGLIEPDEGRVEVCGHEVKRHPITVRGLIGYLPENLVLYERLTGKEFLQFVAGIKGVTNSKVIDEELEHFDLGAKKDLLIKQYSFGMKKRIGLIAALLADPQILILDEPLNGLDVETITKVRARVQTLRLQGKAVIFSSHIMDFVERVASRVVILKKGELVADGTVEQLRTSSNLPAGHFEDVFFHFAK
ncbi:MAG: ABC transporter ATP-binding protein [Blastocatellia bacterium]|nr:ABC transporter ATP-binding protein [Blastocatellia bacterium]